MIEASRSAVDEFVCLNAPADFDAVGDHYLDFHQFDDSEVMAALARARDACNGPKAHTNA